MNDKTAIEKIRALKRNVENDMPDYDYGWDAALDKAIEALAALEAEKPAESVRVVAGNIIGMAMADYTGLERQLENDTDIASDMICRYAAAYHVEQCKACSCNWCENEGQGMPICEICQRNPNRSDYYKPLPEAPHG